MSWGEREITRTIKKTAVDDKGNIVVLNHYRYTRRERRQGTGNRGLAQAIKSHTFGGNTTAAVLGNETKKTPARSEPTEVAAFPGELKASSVTKTGWTRGRDGF